ncbi:MAG: deoxyribose-phosphate aldolase [Flavobacteriaceae bacterium]|nr:deoxyribose-phosphate aldolase [Flavobacteriaceae bacterium]
MKYLLVLLVTFSVLSCKEETKDKLQTKKLTAQAIIDKAIETSCNGNCDNAVIEFTFRDKQYRSSRNNGNYKLERIKKDSLNTIHDVVTNNELYRYINEELTNVPDTMVVKISDGVNSVHYFAQLPYGLNAEAVNKKLISEDEIKGIDYYEIEVAFSEEGGGTDFDDTFLYWINKETFTVDYLAYKYATNGGGVRFREAYNPRVVEGIRFVDYNNFKPDSKEVNLSDLDKLFAEGKLKLLSKIETENVKVTLPKD